MVARGTLLTVLMDMCQRLSTGFCQERDEAPCHVAHLRWEFFGIMPENYINNRYLREEWFYTSIWKHQLSLDRKS